MSDAYWVARRSRSASVAGVDATFPTRTVKEAKTVRRLLRLESTMLTDFLCELKPDDVFWDVGAHVGIYSCFAANVLSENQIAAFEPLPETLEQLRTNLAYNDTPSFALDCALSNESGTAKFDSPSYSRTGWDGIGSLAPDPGENAITVPTRTGDELIANGDVPPPTVVKIDVEGAELPVIEGMEAALSHDRCRLIYCEVHRSSEHRRSVEDYGGTPTDIEDALERLGADPQRLVDRDKEFLVKAQKRLRPHKGPSVTLPKAAIQRHYLCFDPTRVRL
ncbi:FkbM family methyltransferase [Halocatena pleomorpha]